MENKKFKILTFLIFVFFSVENFAEIIKQIETKTHLRWNLFALKDHIVINKEGNDVFIQTLDSKLLDQMEKDLGKIKINSNYFKSVKIVGPGKESNVSRIKVSLKSDDVEIFTFYKDRDRSYVLDFWKEQDDLNFKINDMKKKNVSSRKIKTSRKKNKSGKGSFPPLLKRKTVKNIIIKTNNRKKRVLKKKVPYRDFRYGASFIWDYPSLSPQIKASVNLERKTPEYFFPIKNVDYEKSEELAHLQLCINLFRKKKWGLMNKSIKLYYKKYGEEKNFDILEYLKANAILRENFDNGNRGPVKMAMVMFANIGDLTNNYELKKGIYKYFIQYSVENSEYVSGLKYAKKFYVASKENFDYEESGFAVESILNSLSKLNQVEKIEEVVKEKTIVKVLEKQKLIDYEIYANHKRGELDQVINIFEKYKKGFSRNIRAGIIYNTAEAYFRKAQYNKAKNLFDTFLKQHSYHTYSSYARMRMAQIFDLTNRDIKKTLLLYKTAINRVQDKDVLVEAKIRYVGLRTVRKKNLNKDDLETRVFMDLNEIQRKSMIKNNKKLLWLTRLRAFIVDKKYNEALSYLKAIPLSTLRPSEKRVFEADGAEIVYGIIENYYKNSEYSNIIKAWEIYKEKYVEKVANDPYLNFIVGSSYIKLGLFDSFERVYEAFSALSHTPSRTYPIWVDREKRFKREGLLIELDIIKNIKLKNWSLAERLTKKIENKFPHHEKINYYKGIINFNQNDYFRSAQQFEQFLAEQDKKILFDPVDLATMIQSYTDALYEIGKIGKYKKVAKAVLADTATFAPTNPFVRAARERVSYLMLEILAGEATPLAYINLENEIKKFKKSFKDSDYLGRINYLLGVALIKNKKSKEGKAIYRKILEDNAVSNYIKELVRSELSLLAIKERTI